MNGVEYLEKDLEFVQTSENTFLYYHQKEYVIYVTFYTNDVAVNKVDYLNAVSIDPQQRVHNNYHAILTALTKAGHPLAKGILRNEKIKHVFQETD